MSILLLFHSVQQLIIGQVHQLQKLIKRIHDKYFFLSLFVVTHEESMTTIPGEVKFDRDRDTLFIRCQVRAKQSIYIGYQGI